MSDSQGAPLGDSPIDTVRPTIDVKAMPHILRRIVLLALKVDPVQVILAVLGSLGAAVATLAVPRLFGLAINQINSLLKAVELAHKTHAPAAQTALLEGRSMHALWVAAILIIIASTVQGLLTGVSSYQAERVSQEVAYHLRLQYFRQLQRLSFGFHDKIHSGDLIT